MKHKIYRLKYIQLTSKSCFPQKKKRLKKQTFNYVEKFAQFDH